MHVFFFHSGHQIFLQWLDTVNDVCGKRKMCSHIINSKKYAHYTKLSNRKHQNSFENQLTICVCREREREILCHRGHYLSSASSEHRWVSVHFATETASTSCTIHSQKIALFFWLNNFVTVEHEHIYGHTHAHTHIEKKNKIRTRGRKWGVHTKLR